MADLKKVIIHSENDETTARIVVGFLESHGIEASISEDDAGDQLPSLEAVRGVKIFVSVDDAERASKLLQERESD